VSGLKKVIEEIVSPPEARIVMKFDPFPPVKESGKVPSFAATLMSSVLPFALFRSTMKSVNVWPGAETVISWRLPPALLKI
jgi:hypothetical protein